MIDEEALLAALRMAAGHDPVPRQVTASARHAYTLRTPGAVTAPRVPIPRTHKHPPHRNSPPRPGPEREPDPASRPRLLRFAAAGLAVDVEITVSDGLLDLAGRLLPNPGPGSRIDIRTPHLTQSRDISPTGHFAATGLPPGWFTVVCHRTGQPPSPRAGP
ncbi:hypothetical protein [Thermocatellispora tengchongensis]|uniref:hypothetical protein n=1 Tax=Thermocatellispora tengchongensis TaxID=1073253 RepID=UPI00363187D8